MKENEKHKNLLVIVLGLLILHFIFHKNKYLLDAAVIIGVVSLAIPIVGDWILWGWGKIGEVLGYVNTRILLGLTFFFFLTPIALISKIFKKDTLHLKDNGLKSIFRVRDHLYTKEDLEDLW